MVKVRHDLSSLGLLTGIVTAENVQILDTPLPLRRKLEDLIAAVKGGVAPNGDRKKAVRELLRAGGFKPSGRNKPASEYLLQAAGEERFPFINNLVDINNYVSLLSGLPVSLLDLDAVGETALLRLGLQGESYVFNSAGQAIDLEGLICVCREEGSASVPLGNAVKDSMQGKIKNGTARVMGVIYAPRTAVPPEELRQLVKLFGELIREYGGGEQIQELIL